MDRDPAHSRHASDRVRIEIGNAGDASFLLKLAGSARPNVILDDGTHLWAEQILALRMLYPVLLPGGLFIIEDIHTSFGDAHRKRYAGGAAFSAFDEVRRLAEGLTGGALVTEPPKDEFHTYFKATAEMVVFLRNAVIIRKAPQAPRPRLPAKLRLRHLAQAVPDTRDLDSGGAYTRITPRIFTAPAVIVRTISAQSGQIVEPPKAQVASLQNCVILGDGVVVTRKGVIIRESLINQQQALRFAGCFRPSPKAGFATLEGSPGIRPLPADTTHVLLKQRWDSNYGHWLVESLPRLDLVREIADLTRCHYIVRKHISEQMRQVVLDSLAIYGITEAQVIFADDSPLSVPSLIYPAPLTVQPWVKAPRVVRTLERLAAEAIGPVPPGERRLYVQRSGPLRRKILNQDEVMAMLTPLGYEVVSPEAMTLREQMALFASASHIVGNLGAALTNIAFAPAGVRLLALTTEFMMDDFFYDLICHKRGAYWSLHGKADRPQLGMQSDFTIDLAALRPLLDQFDGLG
ncbi:MULTISPECIES: glycosyltransferase family 61 protein [Roseomonadaceae]|uniref:Glycosyltransferase family 61 protein n=1 Tax=Falsiroseomonas oleicola TaxID=2801474 RepID=A0ABS6HFF3_9PROT|nr:glycosyltransferase family 61 protein [Roseomonas oleicola]MBU8547056.1 glycosyltransferase family 61 protein [Roseomonas oleicola]